MPVFRVNWFFKDSQSGLGWSETWYTTQSDFTAAQGAAVAWIDARDDVLCQTNSIEYYRVGTAVAPTTAAGARLQRQALLVKHFRQGTADRGQGTGDFTTTCIKCRFNGTPPTVFRTALFRGVPDRWWSEGGDKIAQSVVPDAMVRFLTMLKDNNFGIRHISPATSPPTTRTYTITTPTSVNFTGFTRRATGRPFGLPRGARPKMIVAPAP